MKRNKLDNYWKNRITKEQQNLLSLSEKEIDEKLIKAYEKTANKLVNELKQLYLEIVDKAKGQGRDVLISDLYSYNKYYEVLRDINYQLNKLSDKKIYYMEHSLRAVYKNNVKMLDENAHLLNPKSPIPKVDNDKVEKVINSIWVSDGKTWSDRIWQDTNRLKQILEEDLTTTIISGKSYQHLTTKLMDEFNTSYNNAKRLAITEIAHVENESTRERYKDWGVNKYDIMCEADACEDCQELAKESHLIDDLLIPQHPNCRCTIIPVIE